MLPRLVSRRAAASPHRALSSATSAQFARSAVVHSSSDAKQAEEAGVSTHAALQRQQLEFCCLLCGWDVACKTCPFNWFNFDPRKFRAKHQGRRGDGHDPRRFAASDAEVRQAMESLGIAASEPINGLGRVSFSQQQVKDAFRAKALEWHPDCNPEPDAENIFKEILEAYELLLAHAH